MSRYDGVLIGFLPYSGEYELRLYEGAVLHGKFNEPLKTAIRSCPSSPLVWLNRQCTIITDDDLNCEKVKLNESA
jgi:hypothetical protein